MDIKKFIKESERDYLSVQELIERLKTFPPNAKVRFSGETCTEGVMGVEAKLDYYNHVTLTNYNYEN